MRGEALTDMLSPNSYVLNAKPLCSYLHSVTSYRISFRTTIPVFIGRQYKVKKRDRFRWRIYKASSGDKQLKVTFIEN